MVETIMLHTSLDYDYLLRAKYFRGRKIKTDWDIRVEQVEFKDLGVSANSTTGVSAGIVSYKSGNRSAK